MADGKLMDKQYVIFNAVIYCKEAYKDEVAAHYPAEVAAVSFNIRDGLSPKFVNKIINPGNSIPIEYGYVRPPSHPFLTPVKFISF